VITIGSVIEGTIPTSIITKTVKTGFMSEKRVFFPCLSELLDPSKGCFKIEPKTIYNERRGFADNPLVDLLNKDNMLIETPKNTGSNVQELGLDGKTVDIKQNPRWQKGFGYPRPSCSPQKDDFDSVSVYARLAKRIYIVRLHSGNSEEDLRVHQEIWLV
jgi:hypothetical protein